jgi:hypothetical protein
LQNYGLPAVRLWGLVVQLVHGFGKTTCLIDGILGNELLKLDGILPMVVFLDECTHLGSMQALMV